MRDSAAAKAAIATWVVILVALTVSIAVTPVKHEVETPRIEGYRSAVIGVDTARGVTCYSIDDGRHDTLSCVETGP